MISRSIHVAVNAIISFLLMAEYYSIVYMYHIFFFLLFRTAPTAYGGSRARGLIRATAAGLHHSHSNATSERLRLIPQLMATLDP